MRALEIRLLKDEWLPGERLEGEVRWHFPAGCSSPLELKCLWYTEGFGDVDLEIAAKASIGNGDPSGSYSFNLELPRTPISFKGKLFSLCWCIEVADPETKEFARRTFSMSPGGRPVDLVSHPDLESTV